MLLGRESHRLLNYTHYVRPKRYVENFRKLTELERNIVRGYYFRPETLNTPGHFEKI